MRIFGAMLLTETNTFSPMPTGWTAFRDKLLVTPDDAWLARAPMAGAWAALAEADGSTFVFGLAAEAAPAGRTVTAVYEALRDDILHRIDAAGRQDVILLSLHGAMAAQGYDDCEGDLLTRVRRQVGPQVVIGVELDLHCHTTAAMLEAADVMITFKEYPHIDEIERARELYALCRDTALGRVRPVTAVFDCAMTGIWRTTEPRMRGFVDLLSATEKQAGVLSVSLAHGFPWADVEDIGAKLWVITDNDPALARRLCEDLGRRFYDMREVLTADYSDIDSAIDTALATPGVVVLADVADNAGGGAPSDSTFILERLIDRRVEHAALGCLWDPGAAAMAIDAGVGARIRLRIGGKVSPASGRPLDVEAMVRGVCEDHGQTSLSGEHVAFGPSAWIEAHGVDIVLTTLRDQVFDPDAFEGLGLDVMSRRIVVVKSMQHFYAAFAPRAAAVLYVATPGAIAPDMLAIPYSRRARGWWPRVADPLAGDSRPTRVYVRSR